MILRIDYIASHDLQEPLRSITSLIEIIEENYLGLLDEEAKRIFGYLNDSTKRMQDLIKALLEYNILGQNSKIEEVNCNELVKNVCEDLGSSILESNATFQINELPFLYGYKMELRLLFQNLLSNAIKFREKDSSPCIQITAEKKNQYWKFMVKDNGIGIDMKYKDKIFTIFQRLNHKNKYEGTGIGLSHCKKIVELHGGQIWVKSKPNQGTEFHFTIITKK